VPDYSRNTFSISSGKRGKPGTRMTSEKRKAQSPAPFYLPFTTFIHFLPLQPMNRLRRGYPQPEALFNLFKRWPSGIVHANVENMPVPAIKNLFPLLPGHCHYVHLQLLDWSRKTPEKLPLARCIFMQNQ
jgi:hypothetical protein